MASSQSQSLTFSSATLFIDGAEEFKARFSATKDMDNYDIRIGYGVKYFPRQSAYIGYMKDVVYYQAALSKEIVRTLIKKERTPNNQLFDSIKLNSEKPLLQDI